LLYVLDVVLFETPLSLLYIGHGVLHCVVGVWYAGSPGVSIMKQIGRFIREIRLLGWMVTWMIWFTVDLQVLLSHSHRFRALVLLGRFLDMGAWAVDLVHPAIYKLNIVWEISQFPAWVLRYNAGCCGTDSL
jgi:hypothetical protein